MLIRGLEPHHIFAAAAISKVTISNPRSHGSGYRFRLVPTSRRGYKDNYWQRMNHDFTRKVSAVCWHGHKEFMRAILRMHPGAVIITSTIRYNGLKEFLENHRASFDRNIGSSYCPRAYGTACTCDPGGRNDSIIVPDGVSVPIAYDNGGITADRWTIRFNQLTAYHMSDNADQANGVCMYAGDSWNSADYQDLETVPLESLPRGVKRMINWHLAGRPSVIPSFK